MALTLNGTTGIAGIAGSAGTPALQGNNDTNTGYFFAADTLGLSTAGSERLRVDSNGNLSIHSAAYSGGGAAPQLYVVGTGGRQVKIHNPNAGTCSLQLSNATTGQGEDNGFQLAQLGGGDFYFDHQLQAKDIIFRTKPSGGSITERLRITSSGRLLLGTSVDSVFNGGRNASFQQEGTDAATSALAITRNSNDANPSYISFGKSRGTSAGANTAVQDGDVIGTIEFNAGDGSGAFNPHALIKGSVDAAPGNSDAPGRLSFWTTPDGGSTTPAERLRITSDGKIDLNAAAGKIGNSAGSSATTYLFADDLRFTNAAITSTHAIIDTNGLHLDTTSPTAANGLDDYEEGVHTQAPVNANLTLTNNILRYTKIGTLVTVSGMLKPSAVSGSNAVLITLPFTSLADSGTTCGRYTSGLMHKYVNIDDAYKNVVGYIGQNEAYWRIYHVGDNLDWHQLTNNDLSTNTEIFFTFTYHTTD